jgi:nicotinate-nucleotide adenylyltransferase
MNIGVFGGSFDPPHNAHVQVCRYALEHAFLDRILLVPTGDNPLKISEDRTSRQDRLNMTQLAAEFLPHSEVSDIEIDRPGQSYTYETIKTLKQNSNDTFWFITGSDLLPQLHMWRNFSQLAEMIDFICFRRKGTDASALISAAERINRIFRPGIILFEDYAPDEISSSSIREMIQNGEDIKSMVPRTVYEYIQKNNLYR